MNLSKLVRWIVQKEEGNERGGHRYLKKKRRRGRSSSKKRTGNLHRGIVKQLPGGVGVGWRGVGQLPLFIEKRKKKPNLTPAEMHV